MAIPQQKFRELVFQMLYSHDTGQGDDRDIQSLLMKELEVTRKVIFTAQDRIEQIKSKQAEIDKLISKASRSYNFDRIPSVERNILRLGAYELLYDDEIPPKVAIAEAIRLTRKFSTPESANFINALLDHLYKASLGEKVDATALDESAETLRHSQELAEKAAREKPAAEQEKDDE